MRAYRGIPGTEVRALSLHGGGLRVRLAGGRGIVRSVGGEGESGEGWNGAHSQAVEEAWRRLVAEHPIFFDGPILSVVHLPGADGGEENEILVRRDRFSRLAVQPGVQTGVRILSVTGVLTALDGAGREFVLLGRRSRATRIYGDMWELGPSGGLGDMPMGVEEMDHDAIFANLADEIEEEVGLTLVQGQAVGIARDHRAMSDDIVFACDAGRLETASAAAHAANWEYEEVRWLATDSIEPFDAAHAERIIPPTRALFRAFGWIGAV